jgi:hypothetical protein
MTPRLGCKVREAILRVEKVKKSISKESEGKKKFFFHTDNIE